MEQVWTLSFLVRTHALSLAHAGLMFGFASGFGALVGGLFSGWLCDRMVQRDVRWQVGLPMLGVLISVPCVMAFLLWPAEGFWAVGVLKIPHAMVFAIAFGFFASWWPSLSYSAISHMVRSTERGVAAALLEHLAHLVAQVDGELGVRGGDGLVLADQAAQLGGDLEHAALQLGIGDRRLGLGRRRELFRAGAARAPQRRPADVSQRLWRDGDQCPRRL